MPFSRHHGTDDNPIIEAIRELAHPMLVVEIEAKTMLGVCRKIADLNDNLRGKGTTNFQVPYPDGIERCECCGAPLGEEDH